MLKCVTRYLCFHKNSDNQLTKPLIPEITLEEQLNLASWKNSIPFIPPVTRGKVIKVYDGDTITVATKFSFDNDTIYRFSVRLNGIDAAEIKGKTQTEKHIASLARDALLGLILGKMVTLKNVSFEKYGRLLADVYLDDLCINKWMLDNNYAVVYNGGTKSAFVSQV